MKRTLFLFALLTAACSNEPIELEEPAPTLTVATLQESYIVDEPAHIRVSVSQRGYEGDYLLACVVEEGACELRLNDRPLSADGSWIHLSQSTETLTLVPRKTGWLRLSLEARTTDGEQSASSRLNLSIGGSPELELTVEAPTTASIERPIALTVRVAKAGFDGQLPVKFVRTAGEGTLQYGALVVADGERFICPVNTTQELYYTATARGVHRFQFSVNDGYTTRIVPLEIIITQ